jgi:hypothetical protein
MSGTVENHATAAQLRATVPRFRTQFALENLHGQLPLRFPSPVPVTESQRFRARSWYTYPGWAGLTDTKSLSNLGGLYIALHLIDFSPLRAELVQVTGIHINAPGATPFDPLSLFLCCLLRWETRKGWKTLARFLGSPEGQCWRKLLGFREGDTPAASTLRHCFRSLSTAFVTDLCPRFIDVLLTAGLLPPHDAQSAIPAHAGLPVAVDGMLHAAHSSMHCSQVTATCYQATTADNPRPCPAQKAGSEGCACDTAACHAHCRRATPRDPEARFIHYSGRNQDGEEDPRRARNVYGYRSYAHTVVDDALHVYWTADTTVHPANTDERTIFPSDFSHLRQRLPQLPISELVADAAVGFTDCLTTIYTAHTIPVVDIRADATDADRDACVLRGYDADGHPLCAHGYPLTYNGLDYQRLRATWVCRQVCRRAAPSAPADASCPFRDPQHPLGMTQHVTQAFTHPDGSSHARLARLFPYNSALWKAHYGSRRNASESRNSQVEHLGLKRSWSYGLAGATADIACADVLINLRTLGRLVQQASVLTT